MNTNRDTVKVSRINSNTTYLCSGTSSLEPFSTMVNGTGSGSLHSSLPGKRLPAVSLVPYLDTFTIAKPTAIMVNIFGTGKMKDMDIVGLGAQAFRPDPQGLHIANFLRIENLKV